MSSDFIFLPQALGLHAPLDDFEQIGPVSRS
jgi:hypothetical protein